MSETELTAEEYLEAMNTSGVGWMKTIVEVARETPDVFGELTPEYDFRGFPELMARAKAISQTQELVPRARALLDAPVVGEKHYTSHSLNSGFFRVFELEGFGEAICKLAIKGSVTKLRKMSQTDVADRYKRALNEATAYLIGELMGPEYGELFPVLTLRKTEGRIAIVVEKVDGDHSGPNGVRKDHLFRGALFDSLTASTDRHQGNYLVGPGGELHLIDHEMNFFYQWQAWGGNAISTCYGGDLVIQRKNLGGERLTPEEIDVIRSLTEGRRRVICQALIGGTEAKQFFKRAKKMIKSGKLL